MKVGAITAMGSVLAGADRKKAVKYIFRFQGDESQGDCQFHLPLRRLSVGCGWKSL